MFYVPLEGEIKCRTGRGYIKILTAVLTFGQFVQ
jgi:hypothetical protein